ncbi:MAG: V-type ATP synthase subunit I [Candidatus Omnitrophica bacterium]|nr:V-type ATP synthase subunit I [Candidatus Omnitrophota bacterium]
MAIAKIKKIEIIGLEKDKDNLLRQLQRLDAMELISSQKVSSAHVYSQAVDSTNLVEIEEAISLLSSFRKKKSAFRGMVGIKEAVYQQEAQDIVNTFDYQGLLQEVNHLRNSLRNISQHRERLIQEAHLLAPWKNLRISLDQLYPTCNCAIFLGVFNRKDYEELLSNCQKGAIDVFCDTIHQDQANAYLFILYLRQDLEKLESLLKQHHFNFVTLSRHKATIQERLFEINREVMVLDDQAKDVKNKITQLASQQINLMVIYDYLANLRRRHEVDKDLDRQKFTFRVSGWVRVKDVKLVEESVLKEFPDAALFISEPEGKDIPVILENPRWLQPFEFITKMYGMPQYNELDPTPFLAPFFFLYFGICVSDAGYGLLIILICWYALKKFPMGKQGWRFFTLFLYCGISTVIVGALMGSWFGNIVDVASANNKLFLPLKQFKDSLVVLDPLANPVRLFAIALSLGIIQVWFGNIVAAIGNIKNRRYLDIILDQVTMFIFLFGATGLGLIFLKLLADEKSGLFKYAIAFGAASLILTQGRSEKTVGAKLFYGVYNLYNIASGYLSDILSYSRLWALGLVTGVMANTINLISTKFGEIIVSMIPFINKINFVKVTVTILVMSILCIAGHVVSFLMNLLGAFVHPVRLQFVEFFSKFFKPGGKPYKPFKIETRFVTIK